MSKTILGGLLVLGLAAAGAGCGDDDDMQPDAAGYDARLPDGPTPDAAPGSVNGMRIVTRITEGGDVMVPEDLTGAGMEAYVLVGSAYTTLPVTGRADGTFTIANVPDGPYCVKYQKDYTCTSVRTLDLGEYKLGRADGVKPTTTTNLTLNVTGLSPWGPVDYLEAFSANIATQRASIQSTTNVPSATPPMTAGQTTLGLTFDYRDLDAPLIDGTKGDVFHLYQQVFKTAGSDPYWAVAKLFTAGSFTMTDGMSATVSGAFTDVPNDQTLTVDFRRSQFDAFRTDVNPGAVGAVQYAIVAALPGGFAKAQVDSFPFLVFYVPAAAATDLTASLTYGSPFPAAWETFALAAYSFQVNYTAPGASSAGGLYGVAQLAVPTATFNGGPQTPGISPPRNPTINGMSAFTGRTGVGMSPVLAWSAPTTGTASGYEVVVQRTYNMGGATAFEVVGTVRTSETSVTIPPGLLSAGQAYVFMIVAKNGPQIDFDAHPARRSIPEFTASAMTALMLP